MALAYMPKSKSDDWQTPDIVFDVIEKEFHIRRQFLFDPCPLNYKIDGLMIDWHEQNFVNPPYTKLKEFVYKAIREKLENGNLSILFLPSKTDQQWFHDIWKLKYQVYWFRGRMKFKNAKYHATQPHFLVKI